MFHFDRKLMQILSLNASRHQAKHGEMASALVLTNQHN